jgi:hypothetical protein
MNNEGTLKISDMSLDVIEKYAKSDRFEAFILCGSLGDCIYHPKFFDVIKTLKAHNKIVEIFTNGSGKKLEWWKELLSMLDERDSIFFAIDGMYETVSKYRINYTEKDFYQFIEIVKLSKAYKAKINWVFIVFNFNEHQIDDAKVLAKELGISLKIRKSSRWSGINDPLIPKDKNLISKASIV